MARAYRIPDRLDKSTNVWERKCNCCGLWLPITDFGRFNQTSSGRAGKCLKCVYAVRRARKSKS
jgi:hypothetical protein